MKKFLIIVLSLLFLICTWLTAACSGSCSNETEPDKEFPDVPAAEAEIMQLTIASKTIAVGDTFNIKVLGVDGTVPTFASDNQNVATVDATGKVTAIAIGEATITVSANGQSRNCYITVVAETRIPVLKVNNVIKKDGQYLLPIGIDDVYPLDVSLLFGGVAVAGQIHYTSTDTGVAIVSENGEVSAISAGTTIIKIYAEYNNQYQDDTYTEITVEVFDVFWSFEFADSDALYPFSSFKGNAYKNSVEFNATIRVGDAEYGLDQITVTPQDDGCLGVAGNVITALKAGVGYITLSFDDGNETYRKIQKINVEKILDDMSSQPAVVFETGKSEPSLSAFDEFADGESTLAVVDITNAQQHKTITVDENGYNGLQSGARLVEIYNDNFIVRVNLYVIDSVISSDADLADKYNPLNNAYFVFDDNIVGGELNYFATENTYSGTVDGKGHVLYNPTNATYGFLNVKAGGGAVLKDIALVDLSFPRSVITYYTEGLTIENVYVSGWCDWGELVEKVEANGLTLKNVIINIRGGNYNPNGIIVDANSIANVSQINVINIGALAGQETEFFTTYADGLPAEWNDSGFSIKTTGLYFHDNLVLKNLPIIDLTDELEDGLFGSILLNSNADTQTIVLPRAVGHVSDFQIGSTVIDVSYDDAIATVTIPTAGLQTLGTGKLDCKFEGDNGIYVASIFTYKEYYLATAEDITENFAPRAYESRSTLRPVGNTDFYFTDNIDGGTVLPPDLEWEVGYCGTIDGRGHVVKNLTISSNGEIYGLINAAAGKGAVIKDIAFVDISSPRAILTYKCKGLTLENVYISGSCDWGELVEKVEANGLTLKNVIINIRGGNYNPNGIIVDSNSIANVSQTNVINIGALAGQETEFFTTYADGLPAEWNDSGFTIEADGLYFNGERILTKI